MVRKAAAAALAFSSLLPAFVWAAEFTAGVNRDQLVLGEGLILNLKLSDASPKGNPAMSILEKHFDLASRGQSTHTSIINGRVSSAITWTYILTPKEEGNITIPSISIETSEGTLGSQPVSLLVDKASSQPSENQRKAVSLTARTSQFNPYKNEPITYAATLVSPHNMTNVKLGEFSVDNAIVETLKEPVRYHTVENGIELEVIEIKYLVTPLKSGKITIPSFVIQGDIPGGGSPFGSYLNDETDSFGMLQNITPFGVFGMTRPEPFRAAADEITLEVKPPVPGVVPWLPATSVEIFENWEDGQILKVGEPILRGFTLQAEGLAASQLPSLEARQNGADGFRIYADKPILEDELRDEGITGRRLENYTLIPQRAGRLVLPKISLAWWNVEADTIAYATLPERPLEVAPEIQDNYEPPLGGPSARQDGEPMDPRGSAALEGIHQTPSVTSQNRLLYGIIAGLAAVLLLGSFWIIRLSRRVAGLAEAKEDRTRDDSSREGGKKRSAVNGKELAKITSAEELRRFLQRFGQAHWSTPPNASLETLISTVRERFPRAAEEADLVLKSLLNTLYNDGKLDIEETKGHCARFLELTKMPKELSQKDGVEELPNLNPS